MQNNSCTVELLCSERFRVLTGLGGLVFMALMYAILVTDYFVMNRFINFNGSSKICGIVFIAK
jgi:hypothetical protein